MPSNAGYYVAAYVATAVVLIAYGISIAMRTRALRARLHGLSRDASAE